MKPGLDSSAIQTIISADQVLTAELYTLTLLNGTSFYFCSLDIPIVYGGNTFLSNSLRIENLKFKIAVGWQVDEQDTRIDALPDDNLSGATFLSACVEGFLDGATLVRQRAYWAVNTGIPALDFQQTPLGVITLFTGLVSTITKIGRTAVEMKLKSPMKFLDIDMPRRSFGSGCPWTLYDPATCKIVRATYTQSFVVVAAGPTFVQVASISPENGADGVPYFLQGRLLFTSGANNNFQTLIQTNDTENFILQYPLDNIPQAGDTFTASAGCTKTSNTCLAKFDNINNFGGFPRIPPVFVSL